MRLYRTAIWEHYLDALSKVREDILANVGRGPKSVINFSVNIRAQGVSDVWMDRLTQIIRQLTSTGAVSVTGSGNSPGPVLGYPAKFGDPNDSNYIQDLIVVGSIQVQGG